jgi:hypothetical protein
MAVGRRRPGEVRDAIVAFLKHQKKDASTSAIHIAVENSLDGKVPGSSIRSYLQLNSGNLFQRTGRGRYRLRQK